MPFDSASVPSAIEYPPAAIDDAPSEILRSADALASFPTASDASPATV